MSEYIISDEQIREAVEFTPPYKTLSYAAKYEVNGAVELQGIVVHGLPEIVRCRDCKWMSKDTVHYKACYRLHAIEFMVEPDGFCAWGERR